MEYISLWFQAAVADAYKTVIFWDKSFLFV